MRRNRVLVAVILLMGLAVLPVLAGSRGGSGPRFPAATHWHDAGGGYRLPALF
jgi:biotin transporter BioY